MPRNLAYALMMARVKRSVSSESHRGDLAGRGDSGRDGWERLTIFSSRSTRTGWLRRWRRCRNRPPPARSPSPDQPPLWLDMK
jgi:hypothetical protein